MTWSELAQWWLTEVEADAAYTEVVTPLLLEVTEPVEADLYLDLGCGEGRVMKVLADAGIEVHGLDLSESLVSHGDGPAVVGDLRTIPMRDDSYDGVYAVLVLEHLADHEAMFTETARVTKPGGVLAVVANHPVWTAPGSTPITDVDGEVLWRPGGYFSGGSSEIPTGERTVTFHHRSLSELLNAAASAGWHLEHMVEQPHHEFEDQAGIPRLLACQWSLLP